MKVNFRIIEVQVSFEGEKRVFDIAREIGNMMMYNGSIYLISASRIWLVQSTTLMGKWKYRNVIVRLLLKW